MLQHARQHARLAARRSITRPPVLRPRFLCAATADSDAAQGHGPTDAELRLRLLETAMLEVPTLGWTTDALTAGAAACELSPMAHGLLPRGPIELVEHFHKDCDARLAADLAAREEELAAEACHLLAAIARLRAPRRGPAQMLAALPSWQRLTIAATDPSALRTGNSQRLLLEALCRAAAASPDASARDATLRACRSPAQTSASRVGAIGEGGDEGVARSECRILASHSALYTDPSPVMLQLSNFTYSILAPDFHLGGQAVQGHVKGGCEGDESRARCVCREVGERSGLLHECVVNTRHGQRIKNCEKVRSVQAHDLQPRQASQAEPYSATPNSYW